MRSRRSDVAAGVLALLTAVPGMSFAHDTWMAPERWSVPAASVVGLDLTSGMGYPALDYAIEPDRVDRAVCRLGGRTSGIEERSKISHSMRLTARLETVGIATISVDLKPRAIEMTPDQVKEYLDEIDAPESIRKTWAASGGKKPWRETYTKHAKTFVRVGEPGADRSWAVPIGAALEIVPESDPTTLRSGVGLTVRVLKGGSPAAAFPVGVVREGDAAGTIRTTDAEGRCVISLDRPGPWLLRGTDLRSSSTRDGEWESDFATLTLEVRPD
ncbi:MAG: DUF4198 domain-containing protein [Acidobacteria bacterium]|nr:DUF4198 domain-containing protein [Acidobacteriota bacterium]